MKTRVVVKLIKTFFQDFWVSVWELFVDVGELGVGTKGSYFGMGVVCAFFTDKMRSWSENLCGVLTVLRHVCIDRELYCTPVEADFEDFTLADLLGKRSKCAVRCDLLRSILVPLLLNVH